MTDTSTTAAPPPTSRSGLDDLFDRLRGLEVPRDTDRRWFGGVCAGIAARFGVDPLLIRAAAIALTIAGGLGIAVYLVLWLLLPDRSGTVLVERAVRHGEVWPMVLLVATGLFLVGNVVAVAAGGDGVGGPYWLLVPVGLVVWLLVSRSRSRGDTAWPSASHPSWPPATGAPVPPPPPPGGPTMSAPTSSFAPPAGAVAAPPAYALPPVVPPLPPRPIAPPPPPRPRRRRPSGYVGLVSFGLAIVLGAVGAIVAGPLGFPGEPGVLGLALALAGVSAVVLGLALSGRASGFSGFLVVVLALLTGLGALAARVDVGDGEVGDRAWTPTAVTLPASYSLSAGDATLDLAGLTPRTGSGPAPEIRAQVGAGQLTVEIPAGLTVRVESEAGLGEIRHERIGPGGTTIVDQQSGNDRTATVLVGEGDPDVVVRTEVGFGSTVIEEN